VHRNPFEERPVDQQVVDPDRRAALERVVRGHDSLLVLDPQQLGGEGFRELGLDRVLDDRVASAFDAGEMLLDE
jgi:hypothetical protein